MGKGGGGGQPQTTTAYQTNLPEYAKPYVENMLNAAQKQVYNDDMTSFRPYTPYSSDPSQYFAGPSGLQQSTYGEAAGMRTPGQYGMATGLGGLAALGQMGAGQQYARQATDPNSIAAYMSPYMQNAVDVQKAAAFRDYEKAMPGLAAQATRQGAFGGSRSAIERAEAQRTMFGKLADIQATGTQQAFDKAQQAQQFGANLGLQGLQGLSSTAGMLGQLGGAQQQADIARLGLQNQLGGQQQQYQQGIINQAVQDYATQQQYPMLQLANMSNLLRGLPMQSATTQTYQAAPNALSQLGGLGATALGVYGASGGFRAAEGGEVKSYASGGVVGGVEAQLMQMEIPQLQQVAKTSPSASIREKAAEIIAQKQMAMQTKQAMGIDSLPAGNLDDIGMAGGGIVAFNGESGSYIDPDEARKRRQTEMWQRVKSDNKPYLAEDFREDAARFLDPIKGFLTMRGPRELERAKQLQTADQPGDYPMYTPKAVNYAAVDSTAPGAATGLPAAPASDKGRTETAATAGAGGKYEKEIEAGLAELKKGLGEGRSQKDLDALREEIKGNQDQKLWMSLIQGGAKAMQSTSPHALAGLGAGLEEGAKTYGKGLEGERADKKLLLAQQSALEQAEYARKSGNLNALIAAQGRLDALKAQRENLAASKELAILSARDKAYGDLVGRLYVQTQDIDQAKAMADKIYSSTNLGGMPGGSKLPEGVVVRQIKKG
jgi:hypothetical protein